MHNLQLQPLSPLYDHKNVPMYLRIYNVKGKRRKLSLESRSLHEIGIGRKANGGCEIHIFPGAGEITAVDITFVFARRRIDGALLGSSRG